MSHQSGLYALIVTNVGSAPKRLARLRGKKNWFITESCFDSTERGVFVERRSAEREIGGPVVAASARDVSAASYPRRSGRTWRGTTRATGRQVRRGLHPILDPTGLLFPGPRRFGHNPLPGQPKSIYALLPPNACPQAQAFERTCTSAPQFGHVFFHRGVRVGFASFAGLLCCDAFASFRRFASASATAHCG